MADKAFDFQKILETALKYHDKEPIIANIIALSVPAIPIIYMVFSYLKHKADKQVEDKRNIMSYKIKVAQINLRSKTKVRGNKRE